MCTQFFFINFGNVRRKIPKVEKQTDNVNGKNQKTN